METRVVFDGRHYRIVNDEHGLASMRQYLKPPGRPELEFYSQTWDMALADDARRAGDGLARLVRPRQYYAEIHPLLLMKELEN